MSHIAHHPALSALALSHADGDQPNESEESGNFYDLNKGYSYFMGMGKKAVFCTHLALFC